MTSQANNSVKDFYGRIAQSMAPEEGATDGEKLLKAFFDFLIKDAEDREQAAAVGIVLDPPDAIRQVILPNISLARSTKDKMDPAAEILNSIMVVSNTLVNMMAFLTDVLRTRSVHDEPMAAMVMTFNQAIKHNMDIFASQFSGGPPQTQSKILGADGRLIQ